MTPFFGATGYVSMGQEDLHFSLSSGRTETRVRRAAHCVRIDAGQGSALEAALDENSERCAPPHKIARSNGLRADIHLMALHTF